MTSDYILYKHLKYPPVPFRLKEFEIDQNTETNKNVPGSYYLEAIDLCHGGATSLIPLPGICRRGEICALFVANWKRNNGVGISLLNLIYH